MAKNIVEFVCLGLWSIPKNQMSYPILTAAMKADRKRLKAEKLDLLSQMKQLYCTLEDKESELRDFIRNYEQRMRESDIAVKQVGSVCCNYSNVTSRLIRR